MSDLHNHPATSADESQQTSLFEGDTAEQTGHVALSAPTVHLNTQNVNLYAQIGTAARPLDRIRRPAPKRETTDYQNLIDDLNFGFEDIAALEATIETIEETAATATLPMTPPATPPPIAALKPAPAIANPPEKPAQAKPSHPTRKARPIFVILLIVALLSGAAAAGYYFAQQISYQSAATTQAEAAWQQAKQEWECTLRQYQSGQDEATKQANQVNHVKENTCGN